MRAVVVITVVALIFGAAPQGVARDSSAEQLVLRGSHSASVEVYFGSAIELACCGIDSEVRNRQMRFFTTGFDVSTDGTYGGFLIERVRDDRIMKAAVRIPEMDLSGAGVPTFVEFGKAKTLSAGHYRIHLLTDGQSTVRIEMNGLPRSTTYLPSKPSPVSAQLHRMIEQPGPPAAHIRDALRIQPSSTVAIAIHTEADLGQAHVTSQCVVLPGEWCGEDDQDAFITPASGASGMSNIKVYPKSSFEAGNYEAVFTVASAGVVRSAHGFLLVFN